VTKPLTVDITLLQPNPWNTNFLSPDNERKLDASMRRFGLFKPIVVREIKSDDETYFEIIGGEHRWEAAKRIGLIEVPISNMGLVDDETAKEIMLADNARYGSDDTIALAELLKDMDGADELSNFLPFSDSDIKSIFSASDIALDELDLPESFEKIEEPPEPAALKAPKTHTILKFKVPLSDAERITDFITRAQKRFGFTDSDEMTNAGDALVHLLFSIREGYED
jgi:ParB/RepB/Spo0J family partition protein